MGLTLRIPTGRRLTWLELDNDFTYLSGSIVDLSSSFAAALALGVGSNLQNTILSNQVVGGVTTPTTFAAGTPIESVLSAMLVGYIPPTISGLQMRLNGSPISTDTLDVGTQFDANQIFFTATTDNPGGNYPTNCSFTSSGATIFNVQIAIGTAAASNTVAMGSTYTYSRTSAGSITFTVKGARPDTGAQTLSTSISIPFAFRNYLAASATDIIGDATAQSVIDTGVADSLLDTNRVWTATCNSTNNDPTKYTYIIYPSSYGALTEITQNGSQPSIGAFDKLPGTYTINNTYSAPTSYLIYKSRAKGAFSSGVTLAMT